MTLGGAAAATLPEIERPELRLRRFTVEEYHRMIAAGVFRSGDPFELLEGRIVVKMTRNPPHELAVSLTEEQLTAHIPAGWFCRIQSAVTTADSEPEPDLVMVRGKRRDYSGGHPRAADTALVVEVAESTLAEDRTLKARIYARAG